MAILSVIISAIFILVALNETNGVSLKNKESADLEGLIYIGSYKHLVKNSTRDFEESNYFISVNPTVWATGRDDCKKRVGDLLTVENQEEQEFLASILDKYGFGLLYWTSGVYDNSKRVWKWATSGLPLEHWAPWGPEFPPTNPNSLLRVVLNHNSEFDSIWETRPNSQMQRYICEVGSNH